MIRAPEQIQKDYLGGVRRLRNVPILGYFLYYGPSRRQYVRHLKVSGGSALFLAGLLTILLALSVMKSLRGV